MKAKQEFFRENIIKFHWKANQSNALSQPNAEKFKGHANLVIQKSQAINACTRWVRFKGCASGNCAVSVVVTMWPRLQQDAALENTAADRDIIVVRVHMLTVDSAFRLVRVQRIPQNRYSPSGFMLRSRYDLCGKWCLFRNVVKCV